MDKIYFEEYYKKALKELNEEGLLKGKKITEKGKREAEKTISKNSNMQKNLYDFFIKRLEESFYEDDFNSFVEKFLKAQKILNKNGISL